MSAGVEQLAKPWSLEAPASVVTRVARSLHDLDAMKDLDRSALAHVTGGMNIDQFPRSENVEDRRGMSAKDSMRAKSPAVAPLPPLVRTPGDLSSQAGLDNINVGRRRR